MRYLAVLLFFYGIEAAVPETVVYQWWPNEWGAPCTTKTDRRELGATCTTLAVKKPKGRRK